MKYNKALYAPGINAFRMEVKHQVFTGDTLRKGLKGASLPYAAPFIALLIEAAILLKVGEGFQFSKPSSPIYYQKIEGLLNRYKILNKKRNGKFASKQKEYYENRKKRLEDAISLLKREGFIILKSSQLRLI